MREDLTSFASFSRDTAAVSRNRLATGQRKRKSHGTSHDVKPLSEQEKIQQIIAGYFRDKAPGDAEDSERQESGLPGDYFHH